MTYENEIQQLTASIWESILRLPLDPDPAAVVPVPAAGDRTLSACVHITGAWRGAVALTCDTAMAAQAARIMFAIEGDHDAQVDEMREALGELANMIGGNVKALLPERCHLSLPSVVEGSDYSLRIPGSKLVARVPFRCGEHPLSVSLLESKDRAAA